MILDIGYYIGKFTLELMYNTGRILVFLILDLAILFMLFLLWMKILMPNVWLFRTSRKTIDEAKEETMGWLRSLPKHYFKWIRAGD